MASRVILSNFFEKQWMKTHPQYLSGLSRALFPTTFLEKAVYKKLLGWSKRTTETSGPVSKLICIYESTKSSLTLTTNITKGSFHHCQNWPARPFLSYEEFHLKSMINLTVLLPQKPFEKADFICQLTCPAMVRPTSSTRIAFVGNGSQFKDWNPSFYRSQQSLDFRGASTKVPAFRCSCFKKPDFASNV